MSIYVYTHTHIHTQHTHVGHLLVFDIVCEANIFVLTPHRTTYSGIALKGHPIIQVGDLLEYKGSTAPIQDCVPN